MPMPQSLRFDLAYKPVNAEQRVSPLNPIKQLEEIHSPIDLLPSGFDRVVGMQ